MKYEVREGNALRLPLTFFEIAALLILLIFWTIGKGYFVHVLSMRPYYSSELGTDAERIQMWEGSPISTGYCSMYDRVLRVHTDTE